MKEYKKETLMWLIFAIIGAVFAITGFAEIGNIYNYTNTIETTGIITEVSTYRDSDNYYWYKVCVSYIAGGKEYVSRLNCYSSSFYTGKEIKIYYDKDEPSKIGMKSLDLLFLAYPGTGLIFLIIGVKGVLKVNKKKLGE